MISTRTANFMAIVFVLTAAVLALSWGARGWGYFAADQEQARFDRQVLVAAGVQEAAIIVERQRHDARVANMTAPLQHLAEEGWECRGPSQKIAGGPYGTTRARWEVTCTRSRYASDDADEYQYAVWGRK